MNVDRATIKSLRKAKLWSQEELAVACGVGLRTIQRAEGEGIASPETVKSLASVFQIDSQELLDKGSHTYGYHNVQLGTFLLLVMGAILLLQTWLFNNGSLGEQGYIVCVVVIGIIMVLFPTLTTSVNSQEIRWHFGLGLIRKSVAIKDVSQHRKVRNKAWWGVGIRLIPGGLLYNVSGLDAVEIVLKNGKTIRIGTDEPSQLNSAIAKYRN